MARDKKMDDAVIIDMNDGLIGNAANHDIKTDDLAKRLAKAATPSLSGLDELLNDGGAARRDYQAIATGYLVDRYQLEGEELTAARDELVVAAVKYLAAHPKQFDQWQR
ncbi:hypothetical protein [Lacticaseibacillus mingshuiensis]|uniref:Uncharacterized protein n=1 Tax=Lacticaseibacillus mingshuiensis TaxID=2799574 RepID=A0ABW4CFS2_9LACO|nr:hypothetical protein [Lacticaseibacillus mingshuiensis]